jgi:magnesium chelatase subunit D
VFQDKPVEMTEEAMEQSDLAKTQIILAREYVNDVIIKPAQIKYLVTEAARGGVQGHRGELFAMRVAMALCALDSREVRHAADPHRAYAAPPVDHTTDRRRGAYMCWELRWLRIATVEKSEG